MPAILDPTADLMRLAAWAVRQWRTSPDYQDILSEAYLAAWLGYQGAVKKGLKGPLGIAFRQAAWSPRAFLGPWYGNERYNGKALFRSVSLEVLVEAPAGRFEDRLLDRLEEKELVRRIWQVCTAAQRLVIYRLYWLGETKGECAAALGIAETAVGSRHRAALAKARELVKEAG